MLQNERLGDAAGESRGANGSATEGIRCEGKQWRQLRCPQTCLGERMAGGPALMLRQPHAPLSLGQVACEPRRLIGAQPEEQRRKEGRRGPAEAQGGRREAAEVSAFAFGASG